MTEARRGGARRRRVTYHELIQLANFITDRDREIAFFLYRHQVLTTGQLELQFFPSRRAAQKRLLKLHEHVVVERFYPPIPYGQGRRQAHWVLGDAGVKLVAACAGASVTLTASMAPPAMVAIRRIKSSSPFCV